MIGVPKALRRTVDTGMRRVSWVRIQLDHDGAHCEVVGVGHRLPTTRPVALETALALAASGVPTVVRSSDGTAESETLRPTG